MDGDFLSGIEFSLIDPDPYEDEVNQPEYYAPPFDCFTEPIISIPQSNYRRQKRDVLRDRPISISNISNSLSGHVKKMNNATWLRMMPNISWFNISDIHSFEKLALPEFFDNSGDVNNNRTPEMYKEFRNYMIDAYQSNPTHYLSVVECRKNLSGDANAVFKVHSFLEHLGLINYTIVPETHYTPYSILSENALENIIQLKEPELKSTTINPHTLVDKNEVIEKFTCNLCQSDCTKLRYYNRNHEGYFICFQCYAYGNYPEYMFSSEFDKIDLRQLILDDIKWEDEETLKLLEGTEMYGDDWDSISAHVGTKNREECFYHFITLPIEDGYYQSGNLASNNMDDLRNQIPFLSVSNPVMTLIVYLRDSVSPQVASAAAKAALQCYMNLENDVLLEAPDPKDQAAQATQAAMIAAVNKAKELAEKEDRDIEKLSCDIIDAQMKKIEKKLSYFDKFEEVLQKEQDAIAHAQQKMDREMKYMYNDGLTM